MQHEQVSYNRLMHYEDGNTANRFLNSRHAFTDDCNTIIKPPE